MSIPLKVVLEREIEFRQERTIATIRESKTGGPARPLITGREPHETGRMVCIKAGFRAMDWESRRAESPCIELAEVASPVRRLMAQPHRLDMRVTGPQPVLTFFPDFELAVDARFIEDLARGTPFWAAALRWEPHHESFDWRTLILEVKDDRDPRLNDSAYSQKLELARQVYGKLGWSFASIVRSRDLPSNVVAKGVHKVWLRNLTHVTVLDVARVSRVIEGAGGRGAYAEVASALGPGPLGRHKLAALHVRRVVRIDLSRGLTPDSPVSLINDGGAVL
jgi:hypothetical protein